MITGVVLARNEERNIEDCLHALRPHVEELLLIDMESTDRTVELATPLVDRALTHALISPFDAARNIAIPEAKYDWLWFVDADERVPDRTGKLVRDLLERQGDQFEAISIPFKSYFCGQWMRHCGWWPGYTMPRVLRRGAFRFAERLHGGVELEGREARLPPDPGLAVDHFSYESVEHYLEKLNRYTSAEAQQLAKDGLAWDWRRAMSHMLHDLWMYFEAHPGRRDGERGWILSWLSGQYRWLSHAKLIDQVPPTNDEAGAREINAPVNLDDVVLFLEEELSALRRRSPQLPLGLVWRSPLLDYSGYADEARAFCKALAEGTRPLTVEEIRWNDKRCGLPARDLALYQALRRARRAPWTAAITDCIPTMVQPDRCAAVNILRTTFEVDRLPGDWPPAIEAFDEVWVTSEFAARTFRRSGVAPEKLRVVWPSIDTDLFRTDGPARRRPESLENRFVFLSVLEWQQRKGWDVLLRAFARALAADDSVGLLLKVTCLHGQSREQIRAQADAVLRECGLTGSERPEIVWMFDVLDAEEMAALYRGADAFVLPSRGEGWGRPYMEALACGLPVIATAASGQTDFLHDENALLIPAAEVDVPESAAREIPTYRGARWFEPDENALRAALRELATCPQTREKLVRRGLSDVAERFGPSAARARIESALAAAESRFAPVAAPPVEPAQIRVELEGEFFAAHSFSNINERLARGFAADPSLALSIRRRFGQPCQDEQIPGAHELRPWIGRELPGGPEITIRHAFPPNWQPLSGGKWVHIQPWEFGHLPADWIEPLRERVDEIWAPSEYVRRVYERSGIPNEKIQVIPWGIDPDLFSPEAPPLHLAAETVQGNISEGTFKFLFVGGTIHRKGFDRLLEAYLSEFTRDDDVCLVIKDQGTDTFYRFGNGREAIHSALSRPNNPKLVYLDRAMTPGQLASLYSACDCLAMPYRGEGFGLPILEAMACGLAVIVPRGGASDDFVDQTTGLLLPAREVETTHDWPLVGPALELQVDPADLRRALRRAYEDRDETAAMGAAAARHARQNFTWTRALAAMRERMRILIGDRSQENPQRGMCLAACVRFSGADQFAQDPSAAWNLSECLARLRPFVDELLVVGDHLPRAYQAIAGEYGARCVTGPDDEAAGAVSRTFDWSLSIEAGEPVDPEDLRPLRGILAAQPPSVRQLQIQTARAGTGEGPARFLSVARREKTSLDRSPNREDFSMPLPLPFPR